MTSMVKSQKQFADTSCEVEALLGVQDCSHLTLDLLRMQNISKHLKGIVAGVNNGIRDVYNIHVAPRISQTGLNASQYTGFNVTSMYYLCNL